MSDTHDTMTREQLEAAGYEFYEAIDDVYSHYAEVFFDTPDGYESPHFDGEPDSMAQLWEQATQAATAHYQQQQELARLRTLEEVLGDAIVDLHILANRIHDDSVTGGVMSVLNVLTAAMDTPPTVSKTEQPD